MSSASARQCQPCTACCDGWVRISVFDQPVLPGRPCPHSAGPRGGGCAIYADRPADPCRNFHCGWIRDVDTFPDWMKPNESKAIVLPAWTTWRTFPVDLALPVGPRIPQKALDWLKDHSRRTFRPLLYTRQELDRRGRFTGQQLVEGFGPPSFQAEMATLVQGRELA